MSWYTKREKKHILFTIIMLALVFAFNDKRETFELSYWLANLVKVLIIVAVSIILHDLAHKLLAARYGFHAEHRTWGIRGFSWKNEPSFPKQVTFLGKKLEIDSLPLGAVLGLLVMVFSNGKLYFAALEKYDLIIERISRFGKKFVNVTDYEEAKIAIAGPLVNVSLAIILSFFGNTGLLADAAFINALIAVFHMLPLPGLDGFKVLMGSIPLYIFSVAFMAGVAFLIKLISPVIALALAGVLAVLFAFLFFYFRIFHS